MVIFGYPFSPDLFGQIPIVTAIFALCPWDLYVKALSDLGKAVDQGYDGISWAQRDRCAVQLACHMAIHMHAWSCLACLACLALLMLHCLSRLTSVIGPCCANSLFEPHQLCGVLVPAATAGT